MTGADANSDIRQQALFTLSRMALREIEISSLLRESTRIIADVLCCECVSISEFDADGQSFQMRACSGIDGERAPKKRYFLIGPNGRPNDAPLVNDSSEVTIPLSCDDMDRPYGVLEAKAVRGECFANGDIRFLQTAAGLISQAITRCRLEEELRKKVLDLHVAHRKKDGFLASISHELRNPLNAILGSLEVIRDMDRNSPEFDESLRAIERNAKSEAKLVLDILELSRIITGKMRLEMSRFSLAETFEYALPSVRVAAKTKGLRLSLSLSHQQDLIYGDKERLLQVVWNLLSNAIKFTPAGGSVAIQTAQSASSVEFSIEDSGIGIDPERLPYVFDRFWQEEFSGLARRHQGLGLGLSIVRQIVELHGGTVTAESAGRSRGARFTVRLPLLPAEERASMEQPTESRILSLERPTERATLDGLTFIVVDDSEDSLTLLSVLLEGRGAKVRGFASATEGLRAAQSEDFDLLISDLSMPEMDGFALIKEYRDWEKARDLAPCPAIALSGFAGEENSLKVLQAGFDCHLAKPVGRDLLEAAILRLLRPAPTTEG